jgi:hypothetical protein
LIKDEEWITFQAKEEGKKRESACGLNVSYTIGQTNEKFLFSISGHLGRGHIYSRVL